MNATWRIALGASIGGKLVKTAAKDLRLLDLQNGFREVDWRRYALSGDSEELRRVKRLLSALRSPPTRLLRRSVGIEDVSWLFQLGLAAIR
jgi:hypothetical protein